jgi:hypothetical protein
MEKSEKAELTDSDPDTEQYPVTAPIKITDLKSLAKSIKIDPTATAGPKSQLFVDAILELDNMIGLEKIKLQLCIHLKHALGQLERGTNRTAFHNIIVTGEAGHGKSDLALRIGKVFSTMCFFNPPDNNDEDDNPMVQVDRKELISIMNYFRTNLKKLNVRHSTSKYRLGRIQRKRKILKRLSNAVIHRTYYSIPGITPFSGNTIRKILSGQFDETEALPNKYNINDLLNKKIVTPKIGPCKVFNKSDLVGKFVGQTCPKTLEALKSIRGGAFVLDEAYSLLNTADRPCSFGIESLNAINQYMSEHPQDQMVIFCGYRDMIQGLYENQRGLYRRFNWVYHIEDYSPKELATIFMSKIPEQIPTKLTVEELESLFKEHMSLFKNSAGDIVNLCNYAEIEMDFMNDDTLQSKHILAGIQVLQEKKKAQDGESKTTDNHMYL